MRGGGSGRGGLEGWGGEGRCGVFMCCLSAWEMEMEMVVVVVVDFLSDTYQPFKTGSSSG